MNFPNLRVAIIEPDEVSDPLQLPAGTGAQIVLRTDLTPEGMDLLVAVAVRVAVLDLRQTCPTQIAPAMRLLRLSARSLRLVAVTDPSDDAAAQACIAAGALAHLGRGAQTPLALLRAVNAASQGVATHGETGQRAVRRVQALS